MKDNFKLALKISAKTALKWAFIFGLGSLITIITLLIALYNNIGLAGGGHGSPVALFLGLLTTNIFAFILIFGFPIFIFIYFILANKASIQNAIYLLWKGKAGNYISSKVGSLTKVITEKEGWRKELSDKAVLKARILQVSKDDELTSKLQRKIINFGFKKVNLDDIDFQDESLNLSDLLTDKFNTFVAETAKPSYMLFLIVIFIQIALLVGSFFF